MLWGTVKMPMILAGTIMVPFIQQAGKSQETLKHCDLFSNS